MHASHFLFYFFLTLVSCGTDAARTAPAESAQLAVAAQGDDHTPSEHSEQDPQALQPGDKVVLHGITDPRSGKVVYHMPLPASWQVHASSAPGEPCITGPGGLSVTTSGYQSFMHSADPMVAHVYSQNGVQMRAPAGLSAIMQGELSAALASRGYALVRTFALPQVAAADARYAAQLYTRGYSQYQHEAAGAEWDTPDGTKVLTVVHYMENHGQGLLMWGFYVETLQAPSQAYVPAAGAFIHGLAGKVYSEQAINEYNMAEQQRLQSGDRAFQQRMATNQQNFENSQRLHRETWNAVNEASMGAYKSRMESMDAGQQQFRNYINDEETISEPASGQSYQVESGYNQYYTNGNGVYIGSNGVYNPNEDPSLNSGNYWEEAPIVR